MQFTLGYSWVNNYVIKAVGEQRVGKRAAVPDPVAHSIDNIHDFFNNKSGYYSRNNK